MNASGSRNGVNSSQEHMSSSSRTKPSPAVLNGRIQEFGV